MDIDGLRTREFVVLPEDLGMPVWRYMDFPKFISMLAAGALHFVRADHLGDPFEGSVSASSLQARPDVAHAYSAYMHAHGLAVSAQQIAAMIAFTRERMPRQVLINCWHMNKAESAAMWALYSQAGQGIAIRSTLERLLEALPEQYGDAAIGASAVTYMDYET